MAINFGQNPGLNGYSPVAATVTTVDFNARILLDQNYIANIALPTSGATANTNALNFYVPTPFPTTETVNVQILVAANTNTTNNAYINATIQHTEDNGSGSPNSNWVNIATLTVPILATQDNNGTGNPGGNVILKLPTITKQYIRAQFVAASNGGNASASNGTIQVLF